MTIQQTATEKRRGHRFSPEQRLRIVKEWKATGNRVEVAEKYAIHPRTLYRWKKMAKQGAGPILDTNELRENRDNNNPPFSRAVTSNFGINKCYITLCQEKGFLPPIRKHIDKPVYTELDLMRLKIFRKGINAGCTVDELVALLGLVDGKTNELARINAYMELTIPKLYGLERRRDDASAFDQVILDRDIELLTEYLDELRGLGMKYLKGMKGVISKRRTRPLEAVALTIDELHKRGEKEGNSIEANFSTTGDSSMLNELGFNPKSQSLEDISFGDDDHNMPGGEGQSEVVADSASNEKLRDGATEEMNSEAFGGRRLYCTIIDSDVRSNVKYLAESFISTLKAKVNCGKEKVQMLKLKINRNTEDLMRLWERWRTLGLKMTIGSIFTLVTILAVYMNFSHRESPFAEDREPKWDNSSKSIYVQKTEPEDRAKEQLDNEQLVPFRGRASVGEVETSSVVGKRDLNKKAFTTDCEIAHIDESSETLVLFELENLKARKSEEPSGNIELKAKSTHSNANAIPAFIDSNNSAVEVSPRKRKTVKKALSGMPTPNEEITIRFGRNLKTIPPESYEALERVARSLNSNDRIVIRGYTDSAGDYKYNVYLSRVRAELVRKFFTDRGINPENIETQGFGPAHPIRSNDSPSGREANRRVEIEIRRSS